VFLIYDVHKYYVYMVCFNVAELSLCFDCDFKFSESSSTLWLLAALLAEWSRTRNPQWIVVNVQMVAMLCAVLGTFFGCHHLKELEFLSAM